MSQPSIAATEQEFVTVTVDGQLLGVPVLRVQDVLDPQRIVRIPLAPPEVAGSLNLRGRIVTAIDLRRRLGRKPCPDPSAAMSVVVDVGGELYSLLVDSVGEVMRLPEAGLLRNPPTMPAALAELSLGIHRLDGRLLVVLDVDRTLALGAMASAA